jgi:hypothetical protein
VRDGRPLLFLIKLADIHEDVPGSLLSLYSANYGDSGNLGQRPHLTLEWESAAERQTLERSIFLEYGRSYTLPRLQTDGLAWHAVSFDAEAGRAAPTIQIRGGVGDRVSPWWTAGSSPFERRLDWLELRLLAASQPIALGDAFTAAFDQLWVRTKLPQDRTARCVFLSPGGARHEIVSDYSGGSDWSVTFVPDELGPWRYYWVHDFDSRSVPGPHRTHEGTFDVIGGDRDNVRRQLKRLAESIRENWLEDGDLRLAKFGVRFSKLERAAFQLETPATLRSESGAELRQLLREVRTLLAGKPVPDQIPLLPFAATR